MKPGNGSKQTWKIFLTHKQKKMQHDNHKIDKQLKQLETQALPDLSRMDEHWQQMKTQIQPVARISRRRYYLVAACLGVMLVLLSYFVIVREKTEPVVTKNNKPAITKKLPADTLPSTNIKTVDSSIRVLTNVVTFLRISPDTSEPSKPNFYSRIPFIRIGPDATPGTMTDSTEESETAKATLEQFFSQLEKPSQEFVINPQKDTVIMGQDGTGLLIPAGTFAKEGAVTLILKEFYSYEDIITNRLSTWSFDKQLITGGMIHISAMQDGKEVNIQPGTSIRWFIPDTSAAMNQMQLFTGMSEASIRKPSIAVGDVPVSGVLIDVPVSEMKVMDTTADGRFNGMTWTPQSRSFMDNYISTSVKVLDLRDEPRRIRTEGSKKVGVFTIADKPEVSREELKALLKEKYNYTKVIIRKSKRRKWSNPVGDSTWLPLEVARQYKLKALDTMRTAGQRRRTEFLTDIPNTPAMQRRMAIQTALYTQLTDRFSVELRTLGWINCDRFYNDNRPKVSFAVDLKDTAANYHTLLAFENIKSLMEGMVNGTTVIFPNIPVGETVKVISVGIQDGKPVAATETVQVSSKPFSSLRFESTTPSEFKEEVATLDK
jgi:hypothetical protein